MDTSPKGVNIVMTGKEFADAINNGEAETLIDDLFWEWERLSSSGKETLNKLAELFKMEGYYE
tara:strand:- start:254 stop:442 length:189 start_codon:yes stop_codon:yes gene_type:complete